MKNILLPTDFSSTSLKAAKYAFEIAGKCGADIYALNVYNVAIYDPNMPAELLMNAYSQAEAASKENMNNYCNEIKKAAGKANNTEIRCLHKQGLIVDEIDACSEEYKIDLIVMGTTGASGFVEKIIGSNTSRVIASSPKPVLAIPEKAEYKGIENIVYATDFSESDEEEFSNLKEIADIFNAVITMLHISSKEETAMVNEKETMYKELKAKIGYDKLELEIMENDNVIKGIDSYVNNNPADIIAMSSHTKGLLSRIFGKNLTQEMAYHSSIPLLALHKKDA